MPGGFSAIDALIATSLSLIVLNAGRRGFLREAAMLVGLIVGLFAAGRFAPVVAQQISRPGNAAHSLLISYAAILIGVLLVVLALTTLVRPVLENPMLRVLDHLAGFGVGVCEAVVALGLTVTLAARVGLLSTTYSPGGSRLAPFLASWLDGVLRYLPPEIGSLDRVIGIIGTPPLR